MTQDTEELLMLASSTTDPEVLAELVKSDTTKVRLQALKNPNIQNETLIGALERDMSYRAMYAAALNPNLSLEAAELIVRNNGVGDRISVDGNSFKIESLDIYNNRERNRSRHIIKILQSNEKVGQLNYRIIEAAYNSCVGSEDDDYIASVLECVAKLPEHQESMFLNIANLALKDTSKILVVQKALSRLVRNPNLPDSVIEVLLNSNDRQVFSIVLEGSSDPKHLINCINRGKLLKVQGYYGDELTFVSFAISSILNNTSVPIEYALDSYMFYEADNCPPNRRAENMLQSTIASDGRGADFLAAHGISASNLPEGFLTKVVMLKARELRNEGKLIPSSTADSMV